MKSLRRRDVLESLALVSAGLPGLPGVAFATSAPPPERSKINDFAIVDLHCHPSLKMYLWGKKIWNKSSPSPGENTFEMQITTPELSSGYVKGMVCAHYLVEAGLIKFTTKGQDWFPLLRLIFPNHARRIEREDDSNFAQINSMLDELELQVDIANHKQKSVRLVIARDFSEFKRAMDDGAIPIAHAIEGAHALGRNRPLGSIECKPKTDLHPESGSMHGDADRYLRNLEALKMRGVCLMTIGHLLENDIAFPTEGISPDTKHSIGLKWNYDACCDRPLTPIGEQVVCKMLDIGMIVDLTHSTSTIRRQVFAMNRARKGCGKTVRPLTFTHTGVQSMFEWYDGEINSHEYDNFKYYDVDDLDIREICECNGVIGVIPENFWLTGCDNKIKKCGSRWFSDGINFIVDTIVQINGRTDTRDYDNISVGTDFDGLADAPRDLYKPSQIGALVHALRDRGQLKDCQIKKITSTNALRLMRDGWTA